MVLSLRLSTVSNLPASWMPLFQIMFVVLTNPSTALNQPLALGTTALHPIFSPLALFTPKPILLFLFFSEGLILSTYSSMLTILFSRHPPPLSSAGLSLLSSLNSPCRISVHSISFLGFPSHVMLMACSFIRVNMSPMYLIELV